MTREKARKIATDKQIVYANAIADALGIEISFPKGSSFYDVTKFLRENEETYLNNKNRKASIRQLDFANAIANTCGISLHFDKNDSMETVSDFIHTYKSEYENIIWRKEIVSRQNDYEFTITSGDLTTEGMLFICDNLFKKSGVYSFIGESEEIIYIGKSSNLAGRIPSSYRERRDSSNIKKIMYYLDNNMANVNVLEILLICENNPLLNGESKTDDTPTIFKSGIDIIHNFHEIPNCILA